MPLYVLNTVTPAPGKKRRVEEILQFLTIEIQKNEPNTLQVQALWDDAAGIFHIYEVFADENARKNHHNMAYTAQLRHTVQEEHLFAKSMESKVLDRLVGFARE